MKKGMKALEKVAAVGPALALTSYGASGTSSQNTAGRKQDTKTKTTGGDASTADLSTLRVIMMPFITSLPTKYIRKNKLNEKVGFKMDTIMSTVGVPVNEVLAADLWSVGTMGTAAVTGVINYGVVVIGEALESTNGPGVFVEPDFPIAQAKGHNPPYPNVLGGPETVKGATILLPVGTTQHFTTLKWLKRLGLGITDVNTVNMDATQAHQALQANQCDAVALNVPTFFEAVGDNMIQVGNLADLSTRYVDMVMANRKAIEGRQELVQRCIDYVKEACRTLSDGLDMAADLMMDFLKDTGTEASRESCTSDLGRVRFVTTEDWKDREMGNFARKLSESYIGLGQLELESIGKFNSNIVSDFVKNGN